MKLAIISGRYDSGKHTVLRLLEDQGYYFIDKLPASLLQSLVNRAFNDETLISKVAMSIDGKSVNRYEGNVFKTGFRKPKRVK